MAKIHRLNNGAVNSVARTKDEILGLNDIEKIEAFANPPDGASNPMVDSANLSWCSDLREPGNTIYNEGGSPTFIFYYTGRPSGGNSDIGIHTSSDALTWSEAAGSPLTDGMGSYQDPYVIPPWEHSVDDTTWYMFAERNSDNVVVRFEGQSFDSISNNETVIVEKGPSGSWDEGNSASPTGFEWNGTWYCMYEGLDTSSPKIGKIGLATADSLDAAGPWTKSDDNPIVGLNPGTWRGDTIVNDELFYNADKGRWIMSAHGRDADGNWPAGWLWTELDPPNWTDDSDWNEIEDNPTYWDQNPLNVAHMNFVEPETGHVYNTVNDSNTAYFYLERSVNTVSERVITSLDDSYIYRYHPIATGSGSTVYEESGNGPDASIINATWAETTRGTELSFNATDAYVDLGESPLEGMSEFTVIVRFNADGTDAAISSQNFVFGLQERSQTDGDYRVLLGDGADWNGTSLAETYVLGDNFIAVRFRGGSDLSLWRDGSERAYTTPSESSVGSNGDPHVLGNWGPSSSGWWGGNITYQLMADKYLSDAELTYLYNALP